MRSGFAIFLLVFISIPVIAQERPERIIPPARNEPARRSTPEASSLAPSLRPAVRPQGTTASRPVGNTVPALDAARIPLPPAFEKPILDLSETIGSLAFLAGLCSPTQQPNPWQRRMEGLVDSEGEAAGNKEKLMGAYNQGYLAFSTTYRQCTDAAETARRLLTRDAARLAREIERRFGG